MDYRYGSFSQRQISETKEKMRKQIFFLLVLVDPYSDEKFDDVNVDLAFENVLTTFGGLNDLLGCPQELVQVMSLLNAAYLNYKSDSFSWKKYRKAILEAGSAVLNIKEV